ncbi:MAG: right-handed parallel beta-helix repeat-containing protein [Halodesulfurarchaeum sp.]
MSVTWPRYLLVLSVVVAIGLVAAPAPVAGQSAVTFVDADISSDTTWTAEDGPYRVVENVTVTSDTALEIEEGTTVEFAEGVTLSVAGAVTANGTEADPVRLTASRDLSTPGAWGSIRTTGSGTATISLSHTELTYGTTGITVSNPDSTIQFDGVSVSRLAGSGLDVKTAGGNTDIEITDSRFQDIEGSGIVAARTDILPVDSASEWAVTETTFDGIAGAGMDLDTVRTSGLTVRGNHFDGIDGPAVRIEADRVRQSTIHSNTIRTANRALRLEAADVSSLAVIDNEIDVDGIGVDLFLEQNVYGLQVRNNQITDGEAGISIRHDPLSDGYYSFALSVTENEIQNQARSAIRLRTSTFSDSTIAVRNNTARANGRYGIALTVGAFRNAVVADNQVTENDRSGLLLGARHVRNTRIEENEIRENGAAGIELTARAVMEQVSVAGNDLLDNAREGLVIETGERTDGTYTVTDNVIAANAYGVVLEGPQTGHLRENAVVFNTVAFGDRVERSDVDTGVGVLVTDGATNTTLETNDIYGNRVGLYTLIDGTVSAVSNYWGAESGPYHRSINPEGEGNAVVTEQGWVDLIEVSSDRVRAAYSRPKAALHIEPQPGYVSQPVTVSAAESTDPDGAIRTYRLTIADRTTTMESVQETVSFESVGTYPVTLWVEDDMGIESADPAEADIQITTAPETTTSETTVEPNTTSRRSRTSPGSTSRS